MTASRRPKRPAQRTPPRASPRRTSPRSARAHGPDGATLRRAYFLARLSRAWDLRFESMARRGQIGRWYSAVGNECTTIGAALAMRPGDAMSTLHRDLAAILAHYLDVTRLAPGMFPDEDATPWDAMRGDPFDMLYRLACQVFGRRDGFTQGVDRSFHYGLVDRAQGYRHVGMISHLGAMLPVAAGLALADLQDANHGVTLGFIGEGATSQGDFHETMNTAGVLRLPLVVVIENNHYAFSTPMREQYACAQLSSRAAGYGIAGETIDGTDFASVHDAMGRAFARARDGDGATLIEAMLPRMRGHAEGDGSYELIPEAERQAFLADDPLPKLEAMVRGARAFDAAAIARAGELAESLIDRSLERARACPESDVSVAMRSMYAPGDVANAAAREVARG